MPINPDRPQSRNLRTAPQWVKGQSGNPKGYSAKARLMQELVKALSEKGQARSFVEAGIAAAKKGDFAFWKYVFERLEGPMGDGPDSSLTTADIIEAARKRLGERNGLPVAPGDAGREDGA
jgi:hypothetical protein